MAEQKPCRKDLLHWINIVSFAVDDVKLFLDSHPCDQDALEFFEKYQKERNCALKEYAKYYGPLTIATVNASATDRWNWINEPWPWQEGGCSYMWNYEKRLQYPVKITNPNPKIAQVIISQFGGPDGELAASMRYLSQRYTMPYKEVTGMLTDIGTEELSMKQ